MDNAGTTDHEPQVNLEKPRDIYRNERVALINCSVFASSKPVILET